MVFLARPLTIRNITIPNRIAMSPMTGYTDMPFRKICAELGAKALFSEMVHAGLLLYGNKKTRKIYLEKSGEYFFAVQIFGSNPEWIKKAVYALSQEDGFAWIDINMGCPVRKVVKEGAGAALMLDLPKAKEIIKAARGVHNGILSIKMRTGWSQNQKTAPELCKIAADEGVDLITIHGRTREDFYTGPIDYETIAQVKRGQSSSAASGRTVPCSVPIFGNGGLMTPENVKTMVEKTGVDGVMIARGAFGNPWIFRQIEELAKSGDCPRPPQAAGLSPYSVPIFEKKEVYLRYAKYLFDYYGDRKALPLVQKAAVFYFKGVEGAAHFRSEIYKTENFNALRNLINENLA